MESGKVKAQLPLVQSAYRPSTDGISHLELSGQEEVEAAPVRPLKRLGHHGFIERYLGKLEPWQVHSRFLVDIE